MDAVHLVVRTPWSFYRGASSLDALCGAAARRGIGALGFVDRQGLHGVVPASRACRRAGLRPLVGAELRGTDGWIWAFVRNRDGYGSLCRALTALELGRHTNLAPLLAERSSGLWLLGEDPGLLRRLARDVPGHRLRRALSPGQRPGSGAGAPFEAVAVADVHYASPTDRRTHRLLRAAGLRCPVDAVPAGQLAPPTALLASGATLRRWFPGAAVDAAAELAAACTFDLERDLGFGQTRFPRAPDAGTGPAHERLRRLCEEGLRREPGRVTDRHRARLRRELALIGELGFAGYFLVVADLASFARSRGIACTGRGSVGGSVVAWSLGLSHVDPVRNGLLFERFLSRSRADVPDVDLDVDWRRRDELVEHLRRRYGADRVAAAGTHVRFGARGALREMGKALGVCGGELDRVTRAMPPFDQGLAPRAVARWARMHSLRLSGEPWDEVLAASRAVCSFPRRRGLHPGGVVVGPRPLEEMVPLFRTAGGVVATQWEMDALAAAGLVKIDLLANRSLGVIADLSEQLQRDDLADVADGPLDDRTRRLVRRGDTVGCYHAESPAIRSLLRRMDCHTFDDLVVASAAVRPGVAASGMLEELLRRRRGDGPPTHPAVAEALGETCGVIVFQEDVLRVATGVCGLALADADALLRAVTRPSARRRLPDFQDAFVAGAVQQGLPRASAQALWAQVTSFAGYAFGKAHSASVARIGLAAAALKAHHPARFMAAVLSNGGGFYHPAVYVGECRRMGLRLHSPCVNRGQVAYRAEGDGVRVGLMQVRALRERSARSIVAERERNGAFADLDALLDRVPLRPAEIEALIRCGAVDHCSDGRSRHELLWEALRRRGRQLPFAGSERRAARRLTGPEALLMELETLGMGLSGHPIELFGPWLPPQRVRAAELGAHVGADVVLAGWPVTGRPIRASSGRFMELVSFEDETSLFDAAVFPAAYERAARVLAARGPCEVRGRVADDGGHLSLIVRSVAPVSLPRGGCPV